MMEKLLGLPLNAAEHGGEIDRLILWVHVLMAVLFVGWMGFFLYTVFRFRRRRNPRADYIGARTHASSYLEGGVAVVEIVLLFALSIPFWAWKVSAFPPAEKAERVRVIAQQFAWNIHYPGPDGIFGRTDISLVDEAANPIGLDRKGDKHAKDDIVLINRLHLPVNKPAIIELTTKDVIHSFAVPVMRVKQDSIPGMMIPLHFTPTMTTDQMREHQARTVTLPPRRQLDGWVAMQDYKAADGTLIARKGRGVPADLIEKLVENGITEIRVGPRDAAEIACAQLCGLGHYRMKGFLTVHEPQAYEEWMQEELADLE
jgi:cytochrome c oxidase subunit 2